MSQLALRLSWRLRVAVHAERGVLSDGDQAALEDLVNAPDAPWRPHSEGVRQMEAGGLHFFNNVQRPDVANLGYVTPEPGGTGYGAGCYSAAMVRRTLRGLEGGR